MSRALIGLLPPPSFEEMLEITKLHSLAGINHEGIVQSRPLRAPHHTASSAALIGGGSIPGLARLALATAACCSSTNCQSSRGTYSRSSGSHWKTDRLRLPGPLERSRFRPGLCSSAHETLALVAMPATNAAAVQPIKLISTSGASQGPCSIVLTC